MGLVEPLCEFSATEEECVVWGRCSAVIRASSAGGGGGGGGGGEGEGDGEGDDEEREEVVDDAGQPAPDGRDEGACTEVAPPTGVGGVTENPPPPPPLAVGAKRSVGESGSTV